LIGFDHEAAVKLNYPIVEAMNALDLPNEVSFILVLYEGKYAETSSHSILSEFHQKLTLNVIDMGRAKQMLM
jgi:hypothetical protein